jgi:hypothetical protein
LASIEGFRRFINTLANIAYEHYPHVTLVGAMHTHYIPQALLEVVQISRGILVGLMLVI